MRPFIAFFIALFPISASAGPHQAPSLCSSGEQVLFACQTAKGKLISVCGSKTLTASTGWLEYRFGSAKNAELVFPAKRATSRKAFTWAYTQHARSASFSLQFKNKGYSYTVFDQNTMGSAQDNGAGVTISKGGRQLASVLCNGKGKEAFRIDRLGCILAHAPGSQPCETCGCP